MLFLQYIVAYQVFAPKKCTNYIQLSNKTYEKSSKKCTNYIQLSNKTYEKSSKTLGGIILAVPKYKNVSKNVSKNIAKKARTHMG